MSDEWRLVCCPAAARRDVGVDMFAQSRGLTARNWPGLIRKIFTGDVLNAKQIQTFLKRYGVLLHANANIE